MSKPQPNFIHTRSGPVRFPAYIPVTTFGDKYPLDDLVRPYLPRLAPAVMVSLHYARQMEQRPRLPIMVDSGGFACLMKDTSLESQNGLGVLVRSAEEGTERIHPTEVLDFQEQVADIAFTLDFPIPPGTPSGEAKRRLELTIANAIWALENRRRRDLVLYACVQGWDIASYAQCAKAYTHCDFDGIAIGGLVPRLRDRENLFRIVKTIRKLVRNKPLHVFGVGKPEIVADLYRLGVQSVDSSSYVKLAAEGKMWSQSDFCLPDASAIERLHLAIYNLAHACQAAIPLSAQMRLLKQIDGESPHKENPENDSPTGIRDISGTYIPNLAKAYQAVL
ncbi:MAG: tRNA-guanine transglycosylase [Candidatus Thiodiazotropha endolucinida]